VDIVLCKIVAASKEKDDEQSLEYIDARRYLVIHCKELLDELTNMLERSCWSPKCEQEGHCHSQQQQNRLSDNRYNESTSIVDNQDLSTRNGRKRSQSSNLDPYIEKSKTCRSL
jgi:hypothetical protein